MEEMQTDMDTQIDPLFDTPPDFSPALKVKLNLRDEMAAVKKSRISKFSISPRVIEILDTLIEQGKINEIYRDRIVHVLNHYFDFIISPSNRNGISIHRKDMIAVFGPNYKEISSYFFIGHTKDVCASDIESENFRYVLRDEFVNGRRSYPITRFGTELQRLTYEDMRLVQYFKRNRKKIKVDGKGLYIEIK